MRSVWISHTVHGKIVRERLVPCAPCGLPCARAKLLHIQCALRSLHRAMPCSCPVLWLARLPRQGNHVGGAICVRVDARTVACARRVRVRALAREHARVAPALHWSRKASTPLCPLRAARCRAVHWKFFLALMSASRSTSSLRKRRPSHRPRVHGSRGAVPAALRSATRARAQPTGTWPRARVWPQS